MTDESTTINRETTVEGKDNRPVQDSELEGVTGGSPTQEQYARYRSLPPSPTHSGNYRGWGGE